MILLETSKQKLLLEIYISELSYIQLSRVLSLYCLVEYMMYIIWISWLTNPNFRRYWLSLNLCEPIGRILLQQPLRTGFVYAVNVVFLPSSWQVLLNLGVLYTACRCWVVLRSPTAITSHWASLSVYWSVHAMDYHLASISRACLRPRKDGVAGPLPVPPETCDLTQIHHYRGARKDEI